MNGESPAAKKSETGNVRALTDFLLRLLGNMGAGYGQDWLFAQPLNAAALGELLERGQPIAPPSPVPLGRQQAVLGARAPDCTGTAPSVASGRTRNGLNTWEALP